MRPCRHSSHPLRTDAQILIVHVISVADGVEADFVDEDGGGSIAARDGRLLLRGTWEGDRSHEIVPDSHEGENSNGHADRHGQGQHDEEIDIEARRAVHARRLNQIARQSQEELAKEENGERIAQIYIDSIQEKMSPDEIYLAKQIAETFRAEIGD